MRVQVGHALGRAAARERLEQVVDGLVARAWPGGVEVRDITKRWSGDRLDFTFVLARGFFSAPISGFLEVGDASAGIEAEVPGMIAAFVGEDRIRDVLQREVEAVLSTP